MRLSLTNLDCGYTRHPVLNGVNLDLDGGELVCLLGPNGSGKSALLKTLAGILPPRGGRILLNGQPWSHLPMRERAARLAYVPQAHAPVFGFTVLDMVTMGRAARWPLWAGPAEADWRAAEQALADVGMESFATRLYTEISGGERQLVLIARALAQEARFLVMDEPASSLDFGNQVRVLQTLRRLVLSGIGVVMATQHPEHALRWADRVALVRDGRIREVGPPNTVLTAARLEQVYAVPFLVAEVLGPKDRSIRICVPFVV
jgi:iron complex transport system ATP-binding protein